MEPYLHVHWFRFLLMQKADSVLSKNGSWENPHLNGGLSWSKETSKVCAKLCWCKCWHINLPLIDHLNELSKKMSTVTLGFERHVLNPQNVQQTSYLKTPPPTSFFLFQMGKNRWYPKHIWRKDSMKKKTESQLRCKFRHLHKPGDSITISFKFYSAESCQ